MTTEHSQPLPFNNALLLVKTEAHAAVDRRALRDSGIATVRVLTSGVQAARLLVGLVPEDTGPVPQLVVCHDSLGDMSGAEFVALIRSHPQLLALPVLTVAANDSMAQKLAVLASGYSALLVRPYAPSTLRSTLFEAARKASDSNYLLQARQQIIAGAFDLALSHYSALGNTQESPEHSFQEGLRCLQERQWDSAIRAFQKAMRSITLKGESELGLATAWKGKGDTERYTYYLAEASQTFARAAQWHRARTVYARLLIEDPEARSPFLRMAERLIRESRFEEAVDALAAGYELSPQDSVPPALARACMCTDAPAYAAERVEACLHLAALAGQTGAPTSPEEKEGAQAFYALGANLRQALQEEEDKWALRQALTAERRAEQENGLICIPDFADSPHGSRNPDSPHGSRNPGSEFADSPRNPHDPRNPSSPRGSRAPHRATAPQGQARKGIALTPPNPPQTLPPLSQSDAESTLFPNLPGLNEALSVAKFTWKMFRAQQK